MQSIYNLSQSTKPIFRYLEITVVFIVAVFCYKLLNEVGFHNNIQKIIMSFLVFVYLPLLVSRITGTEIAVIAIKQLVIIKEVKLLLIAAIVVFLCGMAGYYLAHQYLNMNLYSDMQAKVLLAVIFYQFLVIAPTEEVFFRGYLQSRIDGRIHVYLSFVQAIKQPSVYLTALLFSLFHVVVNASYSELYIIFPGILYSVLRLMSAGIFVPIMVHAFSNVMLYVISGW